MIFSIFVIATLFTLPQGQSFPRTIANRFKKAEEVDVNDITFTTSSPHYNKPASLKPITYYSDIKHEYGNKGGSASYTTNPMKMFKSNTRTAYLDGLGSVTSADQIYITEKPKTASTVRYKPVTVYGIRDDRDEREGFSPNLAHFTTKGVDSITPSHHQQATGYNIKSPKTSPRRYAAKIVPFSSLPPRTSHSKIPTGADGYAQKDKHGYTPSITNLAISGKEVSEVSGGVLTTFPGIKETVTHTFHSEPIKYTDHTQSNPSTYFSQPEKLDEEQQSSLATDYFHTTSGNFRESENDESTGESPHQNESVQTEVSTPHNGGDKGETNLEEVGDSAENMKTGERVEFQMYGMDGPKSYKFGFDTGKGENRHFRFEERDKSGKVKGHYGYIDEEGKMRIMKYEADPLTGFRAGPVEMTEDDN